MKALVTQLQLPHSCFTVPSFGLKAPSHPTQFHVSSFPLPFRSTTAFAPARFKRAERNSKSTCWNLCFRKDRLNGRRKLEWEGKNRLICRADIDSKEFNSHGAIDKADIGSCSWLSGDGIAGVSPSIQNAEKVEAFNVQENRFPKQNNGLPQANVFSTGVGTLASEYPTVDTNAGNKEPWVQQAEAWIERTIFNSRFLALLAVAGSLSGSVVCFLKGCVLICESLVAFYSMCLNGVHSGKMILRLVEAIDVYLAGTVMLIFGMGLYGLFVSNIPDNLHPSQDRALQNSSLYGMFTLKVRPNWMQIRSLDELKTKVGHVIVMILLVKMFERSKAITIATGTELLMYSFSVFLSSASLFVLNKLHH